MRVVRIVTVAALAAALWLGALWLGACSDDGDKPKQDGGTSADAKLTDGTADSKSLVDAPIPDQDVSKKPEITAIIPSDGFADGGKLGYIPVVMTGKNFAAGAAVYIDGGTGGIIMNVTVSSPVSVTFHLPPNPYGDPVKKIYDPYRADIQIMSNGLLSEIVKFQYTNTIAMDSKLKGSVVSGSNTSYADFFSKPIEGKVYVEGVTAETTGDSGKVKVDVGYGATGSDPGVDAGWHWYSTKFKQDDGTHDVYYGAIKVPLVKSYDVAFRFSTDGGKKYVYADTDETDLSYQITKAATLVASKAPDGYCQNNADCIVQGFKAVCKVHATDDSKNVCVECLQESDCSGNPKALGPHCDTTTMMCYCSASSECAKSMYGKACLTPKYCGCADDKDCTSPAVCTQTPDGLQICM